MKNFIFASKKNKPFYALIILFALIALGSVNSGTFYYPDTIRDSDRIRDIEDYQDDTYFFMSNLYYSSGTANKYNTRNGLIYSPSTLSCNSGGSLSSTSILSINAFDTINYSDLYNLNSNGVYCTGGNKVTISFPLKLDSTSTTFSFEIAVTIVNTSGSSQNLVVTPNGSGTNLTISNPSIAANSINLYRFLFTQISNDFTKMNMAKITNGTPESSTPSQFNGLNMEFKIDTNSNLFISSASLSQKTTAGVYYTDTGNNNCSVAGVSCLQGYYCAGNSCNKCHESCLTCSNNLYTDCLTCNIHTKEYITGPNVNICNSKLFLFIK